MTEPRKNLGLVLGLAGMVCFASTIPVTRLGVRWLDPLFLTMARATIAGFIALGVVLVMRRKPPPRELWLKFAVLAFCVVVAYPLLLALALRIVPASHGGVVLGIIPLAIAAMAALLANERPSAGFWLAGAAGAAIVVGFVLRQGETGGIGPGDLILFVAVIAGALAYTLSGHLSTGMPGWEVITWQLAFFLPITLVATIWLWPAHIEAVPAQGWAALAWVAFISQYFSFVLYNAAMAMGGVARTGQLMLLQPFVIVALSVPINGERLDLETILFAAAVVAVVVIGQRMRVTGAR
jgi:drug/metabolite transporter (DMT)-like permease